MKNNNKIYIILSIFAAASLILIVFFILSIFKGIEGSSKELVSTKNNIDTLSAQTNATEDFQKNYGSYKPNLDKVNGLFIDSSNPVDFIEFLEGEAASSKIRVQISLPPSSPGLQHFAAFQISSKGDFSGVLDFLKKIEKGAYLAEIENLTIKNLEDADISDYIVYSSRKVEAALTVKVFEKE